MVMQCANGRRMSTSDASPRCFQGCSRSLAAGLIASDQHTTCHDCLLCRAKASDRFLGRLVGISNGSGMDIASLTGCQGWVAGPGIVSADG